MHWLKEFRTQSDYRGNWYGALTNQCSHTLLGMFWAAMFASLWREFTGEMPPRPAMILIVALPYTLVVEFLWQGYKGDSVFDIFFVSVGAAIISLPFYQVGLGSGLTVLHFVHGSFLALAGLWVAVLVPYVVMRDRQSPK